MARARASKAPETPPKRSGSEKRQRTASILIRLTDEERAAVEDAASRAGLTLASYARGQMLGGPQPRAGRRPPIETRQLARILGELGKIGSNINQLARAKNMDFLTPADRADLEAETQALRALRGYLMEALGRAP